MSFLDAILRLTSFIVPAAQREDWLAEWNAELWYVRQRGSGVAIRFCLGSLRDAVWLRFHSLPGIPDNRPRLESPVLCLSILATVASFAALLAAHTPGAGDHMPNLVHKQERRIAMITSGGHRAAIYPTVSVADYHSLRANAKDLFGPVAYYRPVRMQIQTSRGAEELYIGIATRSLLELLNIPLSSPGPGESVLILHPRAWYRYFDRAPDVLGRRLEVGGRRGLVGGVLPPNSWQLPGFVDAWLLEDEHRFATLPPNTKGFVLAVIEPASVHAASGSRWRVTVPDATGRDTGFVCIALSTPPWLLANLLILVIAVILLPAITSFELGEYPAACNPSTRLRRCVFLASKLVCLTVIVFCGTLALAAITSTPIQSHGLLTGYVLAFRWALADQRRRCPVCLRLVSSPMRVGTSSQTFLAWHGTELMCPKGHGLLQVPAVATSYTTQRWLHLDDSWAVLFPARKAGAID